MKIGSLYLIGSLRNAQVPEVANCLRDLLPHVTVFDDWYAAGPEADDKWRDYERGRGHDLSAALHGEAARNVFQFDKRHLDEAGTVVLLLPAGKSAHLEAGYCIGQGKHVVVVFDDPDRFDVMYQFCSHWCSNLDELYIYLENHYGFK